MRDRNKPATLDQEGGRLLLGYARVSTDGQDLTGQRAELHAAGCARIYAEKITGTRRDRPELARLLDHLRPGDIVTVARLDRLARSTRDLLDIAERIQAAGAGLRSLAEPWADTTTPAGRMVLTVFAGIAEFERSLIIDRTKHGREAAKARGVKFGPRPTLTPAQIAWAVSVAARLTGSTCFPQALTTYTLLRQSDFTAEFHIGVRKTPESGFSAHAWVTYQTHIINGDLPDLNTYTPLPSILVNR